jgi:hypothetical protein
VLLGRQIELRVGWIEILPRSRTVAKPPDLDLAEDGLKRPLMATLNVGPARPVATDHQLQAGLAGGAQIEMILKQRAEQLPAVLLQTRLQLSVLKPPRLLARQPAGQRTEPLGRAREPLDRARIKRRVDRRAGHPIHGRCSWRWLAHRRISLACARENVEKIGSHVATSMVDARCL